MIRCLTFVLLAVFASDFACAEADFPSGTTAPTRVLVDSNGKPARRRCIVDGVTLHRLPDATSEVQEKLGYLEIVFVAEGLPDRPRPSNVPRNSDPEWCLIVGPDNLNQELIGTFRGWIQRKYILEQLLPEKDLLTHIAKKCCIVVPLEYAKQLIANKQKPEPLVPLLGPGTGPSSKFRILLYELFMVYAEMDDYVLIGRKPSLAADETPQILADNLIGWIPVARIARWNTRQCMEWDRTTAGSKAPLRRPIPGSLFLTEDDALSAISKTTVKDPSAGKVALREPWDDNHELLDVRYDRMRFHLLQTPEDVQRAKLPRSSEWTFGKNQLMQLGVIGAYFGPDGTSISAEEVARLQSQIDNVGDQVSDTEILFVIDDTESMADWFGRVAEIVKKIVDAMQASEGGKVRAAVTFYNDAPIRSNAVDPGVFLNLANPVEYRTLMDRLQNHKVHQDKNDNTPLEEVVEGLSQGITKARFQPQSRKIVMLLGDCGDKLKGPKLADRLKLVAQQLIPRDAAFCEFHAVQVVDPNSNSDYGVFRTQFGQQLREQYREIMRKAFESHNNKPDVDLLCTFTENAKDAQIVADIILPRFAAARTAGLKYRQVLKSISLAGLGVEIGQLNDAVLERMFKQEGVSQFVSSQGIQPYQIVYAWTRCPIKTGSNNLSQLRRKLHVTEVELNQAVRLIDDLELRVRRNKNGNAAQLVQEFLLTQIGEDDDNPIVLGDKERSKRLITSLSFQSDIFVQFIESEVSRFNPEQFERLLLVSKLLTDIKHDELAEPDKYEIISEIVAKVQYSRCERKMDSATKMPYVKLPDSRAIEKGGVNWFYLDFESEWP